MSKLTPLEQVFNLSLFSSSYLGYVAGKPQRIVEMAFREEDYRELKKQAEKIAAKCQKQDVCPECRGHKVLSSSVDGEVYQCYKCKGTGKKQAPGLREKI